MNEANKGKEDDQDHPLEHVIDSIVELGKKQEKVSVGDIQDQIAERSFGPFLFIPAIFELSPLGGIPGVPTMLGLIVVLTAAQMLFGRSHFWLPGFISNRSVKGERIEPAMNKIRPVIRFVDKALRPRLKWLTKKPWSRAVAALCIVCALTVPPLELVPFASSGPFISIALIGLGLLGRDGVFVLLGVISAAVAFYLLNWALPI